MSIEPVTTKLSKQLHVQELRQIRLIKQVLVSPSCQDHITNQKHTSTTTVPMATKLGWIVTNIIGLPPIKSHEPLVKWPSKIL